MLCDSKCQEVIQVLSKCCTPLKPIVSVSSGHAAEAGGQHNAGKVLQQVADMLHTNTGWVCNIGLSSHSDTGSALHGGRPGLPLAAALCYMQQ